MERSGSTDEEITRRRLFITSARARHADRLDDVTAIGILGKYAESDSDELKSESSSDDGASNDNQGQDDQLDVPDQGTDLGSDSTSEDGDHPAYQSEQSDAASELEDSDDESDATGPPPPPPPGGVDDVDDEDEAVEQVSYMRKWAGFARYDVTAIGILGKYAESDSDKEGTYAFEVRLDGNDVGIPQSLYIWEDSPITMIVQEGVANSGSKRLLRVWACIILELMDGVVQAQADEGVAPDDFQGHVERHLAELYRMYCVAVYLGFDYQPPSEPYFKSFLFSKNKPAPRAKPHRADRPNPRSQISILYSMFVPVNEHGDHEAVAVIDAHQQQLIHKAVVYALRRHLGDVTKHAVDGVVELFSESLYGVNPTTNVLARAYLEKQNDTYFRNVAVEMVESMYIKRMVVTKQRPKRRRQMKSNDPSDDGSDDSDGEEIIVEGDHKDGNFEQAFVAEYVLLKSGNFKQILQTAIFPDYGFENVMMFAPAGGGGSSPLLRIIRGWRILSLACFDIRGYVEVYHDVTSYYIRGLFMELQRAWSWPMVAINANEVEEARVRLSGKMDELGA